MLYNRRNMQHTGFAFRFECREWNRGRNGLHQLGQPVAPSVLFPVFKSEGKPGIGVFYDVCRFQKRMLQPYINIQIFHYNWA